MTNSDTSRGKNDFPLICTVPTNWEKYNFERGGKYDCVGKYIPLLLPAAGADAAHRGVLLLAVSALQKSALPSCHLVF